MAALLCALAFSNSAHAKGTERLLICFNYGCADKTDVRFKPAQLEPVRRRFANVRSPEAERVAIARAVGMLYRLAAQQSPIKNDLPENPADEEDSDGRMDCIDHSTNTTAFLMLMERRGWLRFHDVKEPIQRGVFNAHWAARLVEHGSGEAWIVDSWFRAPGRDAVVFQEGTWLAGARATDTPVISKAHAKELR